MPHDPLLIAETRGWFTKAANDLRAADHEFSAVPPLLDDIVFHCQQAAEKAMKGFLTWHNRPFRKTHSLEEIGEQCLAIDQTLKPLVDRAVPSQTMPGNFAIPVSQKNRPFLRLSRHSRLLVRSTI